MSKNAENPAPQPSTTQAPARPLDAAAPQAAPFFARYLETLPRVATGLRAGRRA